MALVRGETFDSALEVYMQLRQVRGLSAKYKDEIREEVRAFREECSTIQQVNYPAVKAWTREFEDQGKASKTIKKKLSKLSGSGDIWKSYR